MSSGTNKRQRQVLLGFRATSDEADTIRAAAQACGLSVAGFCRRAALDPSAELLIGLDRP